MYVPYLIRSSTCLLGLYHTSCRAHDPRNIGPLPPEGERRAIDLDIRAPLEGLTNGVQVRVDMTTTTAGTVVMTASAIGMMKGIGIGIETEGVEEMIVGAMIVIEIEIGREIGIEIGDGTIHPHLVAGHLHETGTETEIAAK
jgi:hypothetical protein